MAYIVPNAPIPEARPNDKGVCKFPFADIDVGVSFMVPNRANMPAGELFENSATIGNMRTHVSRHNTKILPERQFKCRIYPEDERWIQVWRIK